MARLLVKTETTKEFFARGREIAKRADARKTLSRHLVLSFEDPRDLLRLLTPSRLELLKVIKAQPGSITSIATLAKRDLDALSRFGVVRVSEKVLAGHGKMKLVLAGAKSIKLEAEIG